MKKRTFLKWISSTYTIIGFVFLLFALVLVLIPVIPYIAYRIHPEETTNEITKISQTVVDNTEVQTPTNQIQLPPLDITLPTDPYISIQKIGVYSPISTESNYTEALKKGAWVVPDYGTPENDTIPIIIAAHRFGYIYWDRETREKISFYNLPQVHTGDAIEIIWGQRKYTYEVYAQSEGSKIVDYSADLVLYTCKYFNSPVRVFRYARLLAP